MNNPFIIDKFPNITNFWNNIKLNNPMQNINSNQNEYKDFLDKNNLNKSLNIINNNINNINNIGNINNNKELKYKVDIFPNFPFFINDNDKIIFKNNINHEQKNINNNICEINKANNIHNFKINNKNQINEVINCRDYNFNNNIYLNNIKQACDRLLSSGINQLPELFPNFKNNFFNPIY